MGFPIFETAPCSRRYNSVVAVVSLVLCFLGSSAASDLFGAPTVQLILLSFLICDAGIRYTVLGTNGLLDFLNIILTAGGVTCLAFDIVFRSIAYVSMQPVLSSAFAVRAAVAVQHYIQHSHAPQPVLRRLSVEERTTSTIRDTVKISRQLDICYLTSRILAVSSTLPSSSEMTFLESKYSNFLRTLPSLPEGNLSTLSAVTTVVEAGVSHLFSNPVNVVAINTTDLNEILVACALLLRTGAVPSGKARASLDMYLSQRYVVKPDSSRFFPQIVFSQLEIFQRIMTKSASRNFVDATVTSERNGWELRRVTISHIDAQSWAETRLTVVEVDSGKLWLRNIVPSITSPTSVTFACVSDISCDSIFVFSRPESTITKVYMNASFHLERAIASQSSYHYTLSLDECDKWSPSFLVSGKLQITATPKIDSSDDSPKSKNYVFDKEMLSCIPPARPGNPSCLIV